MGQSTIIHESEVFISGTVVSMYSSNFHSRSPGTHRRNRSGRTGPVVVPRGVSQNSVIICKFHRNIYFDRGVPPPSELGRQGSSRSRNFPVSIVRHSGLMICKVEGFILKRSNAKSGCRECAASGQKNLRKGFTHLPTIH
jgi:hypothetical protein